MVRQDLVPSPIHKKFAQPWLKTLRLEADPVAGAMRKIAAFGNVLRLFFRLCYWL